MLARKDNLRKKNASRIFYESLACHSWTFSLVLFVNNNVLLKDYFAPTEITVIKHIFQMYVCMYTCIYVLYESNKRKVM